jgi:hypothetical protein
MMEAWSATVTTQCTCEYYDDEADAYESSEVCFGDCFEMAWEDATAMIREWATYWDTDAIRVEANRMTWRGLSGYSELSFGNDFEKALRLFTLDADYTLELSLDGDGQLSVRRQSHDELGCLMEAYPISEWKE